MTIMAQVLHMDTSFPGTLLILTNESLYNVFTLLSLSYMLTLFRET